MNENNIISVLLPVYNEELSWIKSSIMSVISQTYKELEILILLDNPKRKDVIDFINKSIRDSRVKLVINDENLGIVNNLNNGLRLCTGDFVARMDADDIALENRLTIQMDYMRKYNVDFVSSNFKTINEYGDIIEGGYYYTLDSACFKRRLKYSNISCHPTWLFKKRIIEDIGDYKNIKGAEDYEFICRLMLKGYEGIITPEPLISYRKRSNSISKVNEFQQIISNFIVRRAYRKAFKSGDFELYNSKVEKGICDKIYYNLKEYYEDITSNKKVMVYYKSLFNRTFREQVIIRNLIRLDKLKATRWKYVSGMRK